MIPGSPAAYRYLVCGSYLAFYHVHNEEVIVDRILYGRRDYLSILLVKNCAMTTMRKQIPGQLKMCCPGIFRVSNRIMEFCAMAHC